MVTQLCLTLGDSMDCSLPGSSIHGIFQARILEWVAIFISRGSSPPRDQTRVSHIVGRRFTSWTTRKVFSWEKEMATHSSILAWRIPQGDCRSTVHGVAKNWSDRTEKLTHTQLKIKNYTLDNSRVVEASP